MYLRHLLILTRRGQFQYRKCHCQTLVNVWVRCKSGRVNSTWFHIVNVNEADKQFGFCINNNCRRISSSLKDKKGGGGDESGDVEDDTKDQEIYLPKKDPFFTNPDIDSAKENKGLGNLERPIFIPTEVENVDLEEEELIAPTNCCRSGCPNCVWLEYVEKLTQKYLNPELSRDRIENELNSIEDQSLKAFIKLELRSKGLI